MQIDPEVTMTPNPETFVGKTVRISLNDLRVLDGVIYAIDPFGNLLLNSTKETSTDKVNPKFNHVREIGLVSVPKDYIQKVYMLKQ